MVLRYGITSSPKQITKTLVQWIAASTDKTTHVGTFESTGLDEDQIAKKVALLALERLVGTARDVQLHVPQKTLHQHVSSVIDLVPGIRFAEARTEVIDRLEFKVNAIIEDWYRATSQRRDRKHRTVGLSKGMRPSRTIYADASVGENHIAGIGYVIRDTDPNPLTGESSWWVKYGTSSTRTTKQGGSNYAEMQAIRKALLDRAAVTPDVMYNRRSLTIVSDSKRSIDMLKLLRAGNYSIVDAPKSGAILDAAQDIIDALKRVQHVRFVWVEGHSGDMLNHVADDLANWERQHKNAPTKEDKSAREKIIARATREMGHHGIVAQIQ
jgi:ribonuclease HI